MRRNIGPASKLLLTLYLALAEHGRGHRAEAMKLLNEATATLDQSLNDNPKVKFGDKLPWIERVQITELRRELDRLVKHNGR